jgi:hypothetical protein
VNLAPQFYNILKRSAIVFQLLIGSSDQTDISDVGELIRQEGIKSEDKTVDINSGIQ